MVLRSLRTETNHPDRAPRLPVPEGRVPVGSAAARFAVAAVRRFLSPGSCGIVLISSVLDLRTITFSPGDDQPYIFYLPTYAATPFFATEHTMEHLGLPAALQGNIKMNYYASGHMMYLHDESRVKLRENIVAFIDRATR